MGLARAHLRVAEEIGVDAFIAVWRIYDAEPAYRTDKGDLEIPMRSFRSYLRYQRNRVIESLAAEGHSVEQIRQRIKRDLCETISTRHINRLVKGE